MNNFDYSFCEWYKQQFGTLPRLHNETDVKLQKAYQQGYVRGYEKGYDECFESCEGKYY